MYNTIPDYFSSFKSFKSMPLEDLEKFYNYHKSFFKNREFPRFFQSYLYLKAERKYFYYGFINDCFVLVKKYKQFGKPVFYLPIPPININGDIKIELDLIHYLNSNGIKTKLSDEDIPLYSYEKKALSKDKDNIEHIYKSSDFIKLDDHESKKFRYNLKKFKSYVDKGEMRFNLYDNLSDELLSNLDNLLDEWGEYKVEHTKDHAFQADKCHLYFNNSSMNCYFQLANDNIITSSINEVLYDGKIIMTTNYSNYNNQIHDMQSNKVLHCLIMQHWDKIYSDSYINSGSAGWDKGLYAHKKQLKPFKEIQIYDTKCARKITIDEYNNSCVGDDK
jgi:hypothetical protein